MNGAKTRWPGWVYAGGEEPDYRFSLANERTFLAWIRTSLALLAAAVALDVLSLDVSPWAHRVMVGVMAVLGLGSAVVAWVRWAFSERAIRRRDPLPSFGLGLLLVVALLVTGALVILIGL